MRWTRRKWFGLAGGGAVSAIAGRCGSPTGEIVANDSLRRIAKMIAEFESQGFHRTATAVDEESGHWLADQVRNAGPAATLEPFPVDRVDLQSCACTIAKGRG